MALLEFTQDFLHHPSAAGEALERFSAQLIGNEVLIEISPEDKDIGRYSVPEISTPLFSKVFVPAKRIINDSKLFIPAEKVFFPLCDHKSALDRSVDTTGLSSGASFEEAVLQGLLECIERDSLYSYFYSIRELPNVILEEVEIKNSRLISLLEKIRDHLILHIKLIPNETSAYVVHVTTEAKNSQFPKYTHGAGASLDFEIALSRAITECCQLRVSQIEVMNFSLKDEELEPYYKWGFGEKDWLNNLLSSKSEPSISSRLLVDKGSGFFYNDLLLLAREIEQGGHRVVVTNLTRFKDIFAVRVIVDGYLNTVSSRTEIEERVGHELIKKELFDRKIKMFS